MSAESDNSFFDRKFAVLLEDEKENGTILSVDEQGKLALDSHLRLRQQDSIPAEYDPTAAWTAIPDGGGAALRQFVEVVDVPELGKVFAAAASTPETSVSSSVDGLGWTVTPVPTSVVPQSIFFSFAYSPSLARLVAVGRTALNSPDFEFVILTSDDAGLTWTRRTAPAPAASTPFAPAINCVRWVSRLGRFLAVTGEGDQAQNHVGTVLSSPDGIVWSVAATGSAKLFRLVVTPTAVFAFGVQTVLRSTDGVTWTTAGALSGWTVESVVWADGLSLLVAAGPPKTPGGRDNIATSPDGVNWTWRNTPFVNNPLYGLAWSPVLGRLVATCDNNLVVTSTNGVDWSFQPCPSSTWGYAICWSDRLSVFLALDFRGDGSLGMRSVNARYPLQCGGSTGLELLKVGAERTVLGSDYLELTSAAPALAFAGASAELLLDCYDISDTASLIVRRGTRAKGAQAPGPSELLRLDGAGDLAITGNLQQSSDARLKTDLQPIPDALAKVAALRGYTYRWLDFRRPPAAGLLAQEVEAVLPTAVSTSPDGFKQLAYNQVIALLVEAVRALEARVAALETP